MRRKNRIRTGKDGNKYFHPGKGVPEVGKWKDGLFLIGLDQDLEKILDFEVPDLEGFQLKPYVVRSPKDFEK